MPYEWLPPTGAERHLHLWPYRSLPRKGFVWFIGMTACLIAVPLVIVVGSPVLWGLLPFFLLSIAGMWWGLEQSYRDAEIVEDLSLTAHSVTLTRHGPRGQRKYWTADKPWVRLILHPKDGPVPNYLTLKGGPREVELGAFLTPEERLKLLSEVKEALAAKP